ncbi:MAG: hypothetical protein ACJ73N_13975 [Bryobacteraceae bacterium]
MWRQGRPSSAAVPAPPADVLLAAPGVPVRPEARRGPADLLLPRTDRRSGVGPGQRDRLRDWECGPAAIGIDQVLHQLRFAFAHGLEFRRKTGDMRFIESGILARQQDGASGQAGFDGIGGRFALPSGVDGPVLRRALARLVARRRSLIRGEEQTWAGAESAP